VFLTGYGLEPSATLDDIVPTFEQHWQEINQNYTRAKEHDATVAGQPARIVIYTAEREGIRQKAKSVFVLKGDVLYRLGSGFPVELYDT
jgi:hypothetical protein